jgi:hypothetical protein
MDFDGVDDYIRVPNDPELIPTATNAVTYETWIYPEESTNGLGLLSSSGSFPDRNHQVYFTNSTNKITVAGTGVSGLVSNATIPHNTWTHVAVVFDMSETRLYINGQLDNTRIQTLDATHLGFDVTFGQQDSGSPGTWSFQGKMDDIRIWDHARTADQILDHMSQELSWIEPGLAAYYNFNEGIPEGDNSGSPILYDISNNEHNGALIGFAQTGVQSNWVSSPFNFGDGDDDGRPDFCDNCFAPPNRLLENLTVSGIYRATETITLGDGLTFPVGPNIQLRAPVVKVIPNLLPTIQAAAGTTITIDSEPCPNE